MKERLQKIMARAGVASRRKAEELIMTGCVTVDGQTVTKLGTTVDSSVSLIRVSGTPIRMENKVYILLYKPKGYVTTLCDEFNRPKVIDLLHGVRERVFPVGRLDYDTEGLLLLTNDGDYTNELIHPKFKIPKVYIAKLKDRVEPEKINLLKNGIRLEDGWTKPAKVVVTKQTPAFTVLKITIYEGKKRQLKRMADAIGHPIMELKRIQFGPYSLDQMQKGQWQYVKRLQIMREDSPQRHRGAEVQRNIKG
ncbi:MAG: pseudouridine synthase [bacterium]|nr:pseudouridine synthase [bacterium]